MQLYAGIYLFTAKLLYMFRVSSHPSSGAHETVNAAPGTGHVTYRDNDLPPAWPSSATLAEGYCPETWHDLYQKRRLQFYVLLMIGAIDIRNM